MHTMCVGIMSPSCRTHMKRFPSAALTSYCGRRWMARNLKCLTSPCKIFKRELNGLTLVSRVARSQMSTGIGLDGHPSSSHRLAMPNETFLRTVGDAKSVQEVLDHIPKERPHPGDLSGDELHVCFRQLEELSYQSISYLPWIQKNRHIAFIQVLLSNSLTHLFGHVWQNPAVELLAAAVSNHCEQLTPKQLTEVLLSVLYLGVAQSHHMEAFVPPLLAACQRNISQFDLSSLVTLTGLRVRMFQRDWSAMQLELNRFSELMDEMKAKQWTPKESELMGYLIMNSLGLSLADDTEHIERPLEQLVEQVSSDEARYMQDPGCIAMYLRLARKVFLKQKDLQVLSRRLVTIASDATLRHIDKFDIHHIAEACSALRQVRCFSMPLVETFRNRGLELLSQDCSLGDVSNLFYSVNHQAPMNVRRLYESAIYTRLGPDELIDPEMIATGGAGVDILTLSNLAENFVTANVRNSELLARYHARVTERADQLVKYSTRFHKVVRLLIRRPFLNPEHENKFKESVLAALDQETKMTSLALFSLYLIPSATRALDEGFVDRLLASIPKQQAPDQHRLALAINKLKGPLPARLRKQISTIQSALFEQIVKTSEDIPSLDSLYQLTVEIVVHNPKRDPTLAQHFLDLFRHFTKDITDVGLMKVLHVFNELSACSPDLFDDLVEFVLSTSDIQAERVFFLLATLAKVGYTPKRFDELTTLVLDTYRRYGEAGDQVSQLSIMRNLSILQVYPEQEMLNIFSIDYIEQLDRFIEENPQRKNTIENLMMTLNRSAVLECPQLDIPWFHEQYIEEKLKPVEPEGFVVMRRFKDDVHLILEDPEVLQNAKFFKRWSHSPYGYVIDFECILDEDKQPVSAADYLEATLPPDWQRIAILTLPKSCYVCNSNNLIGTSLLKKRHLEIMGYRVVEISHFDWYSMGLSDYHAKVDFLKSRIFSS